MLLFLFINNMVENFYIDEGILRKDGATDIN